MSEQEVRAKAFEIAALIVGQNGKIASHDWETVTMDPYPVNELEKYEFLASLIEQDILKGFPVQNKIKYIFETEGSQVENAAFESLRARLKP